MLDLRRHTHTAGDGQDPFDDLGGTAELHDTVELYDFSTFANPLGSPSSFWTALREALQSDRALGMRARESRGLALALSCKHNLAPSNFIIGTSVSSMMQAVAQSHARCTVGIQSPYPEEYSRAMRNAGHEVVDLANISSFAAPPPELVTMYDIAFDAAVLGNPCYPASRLLPESILRAYLDICRWVVVDERSIELTLGGESHVPLVLKYDNLVVVRSISNSFALSGIPISYCVASEKTISAISRFYDASAVSLIPDVLCDLVNSESEYFERTKDLLESEIPWLQCMLNLIPGVRIFPAESNYVLCEYSNPTGMTLGASDALDLSRQLEERGFLVRLVEATSGLSENRYFCVAVRSREENEALVAAIRAIVSTSSR